MNKIYLYKHNFNEDENQNDEDSMYDKSNSKVKIVCPKLFQEDELVELPQALKDNWSGQQQEQQSAEEQKKLYSRDLCVQRFKFNQNRHQDGGPEEQKFDGDDEDFGMQLWGVGYISSDYAEERDDEFMDDQDELFAESELMLRIRSGQNLTPS